MIYLLLILAGLFKAVKDRLDNPYSKHVFPTWGTFWVKGTGNKVLGQHLDMWHVCDFLYIACWCLLIMQPLLFDIGYWNVLVYFAITQTSFNIFYFIFKKR